MSGDMMSFPDDWRTFVQQYQFADKEEIYTNGSMLIPSFRVQQMVEHYFGGGECEVELREWMRVPVDADGVPIHVGDELEGGFTVDYVAPHWVLAAGRGAKHEDSCRHVKPQTIENVLRDVVTLCANTWKDEKSAFRYYDVDNVMESGNIADFAAEIRKLLGVHER